NRVHLYSKDGELLKTIGGNPGAEPGQLGYVSDALRDQAGNYYVSEFGENSRISKFDADGKFLQCWGEPGEAEGQFQRIRAMTLGPDCLLYVADAVNHRIQVFTTDGKFVRAFGTSGKGLGELASPYDVAISPGS